MKQKIIHYFNQGAKTYDTAAQVQTYVAQRLAARLKNIAAQKILEVGCGTGLFSQYLISLFPESDLLLTDIAPAMIDICQQRFTHHPHLQTLCADGEIFSHSTQFNLITSSMTLHWFENTGIGLQKIVDHLAPGGRFIFAMLGENSLHEWREMCIHFDVPVARKLFPQQRLIKNCFPTLNIETELVKQSYADAYTFLSSLKKLGARAASANHQPTSSRKLRKLLQHYSNPIDMTYEVIYGCYTKP